MNSNMHTYDAAVERWIGQRKIQVGLLAYLEGGNGVGEVEFGPKDLEGQISECHRKIGEFDLLISPLD